MPNQEIVIQFTDGDVSSNATQKAIAQVKNQLETIEVDNIKIKELENGTLKITYYSDVEVSEIKKIVSEGIKIAYDHTSDKENTRLPSPKELQSYQLDVYEIQSNNDLVGSTGTIVEAKSEIIRFFTPDTYATINKLAKGENKCIEESIHQEYQNIAIAIQNAQYKIPEVRAGPIAS